MACRIMWRSKFHVILDEPRLRENYLQKPHSQQFRAAKWPVLLISTTQLLQLVSTIWPAEMSLRQCTTSAPYPTSLHQFCDVFMNTQNYYTTKFMKCTQSKIVWCAGPSHRRRVWLHSCNVSVYSIHELVMHIIITSALCSCKKLDHVEVNTQRRAITGWRNG